MKLCFDSIEEVREFVKGLKGTRGGKNADDDTPTNTNPTNAPQPLQPPVQQGGAAPQFTPSAGPQFTPSAGPQFTPPTGFPGVDPAVQGLVQRIAGKIDGALTSGQPADQVLNWFRGQCGAEAANATLDQIKAVFLAKLPPATLEGIAKLMGA